MSQVQTMSSHNAIDFTISSSPNSSSAMRTSALVNDILSSSPSLHLTADSLIPVPPHARTAREESIFTGLPPLFNGHPDVHLRNGVMNASRLAADGEPDAEKAFFVADLGQVYLQHQRWKKCLPNIQPFYAVKCNPDPYVLRLLAALGTGFDCASNGEINQVLSVSSTISADRIIFANPCKATSFVRHAAKVGVDLMTFDNADELYKIACAHPRAKLVVRILTDDSKSLCQLGIKFGAPMANVSGLLAKARELNLDVVGVSFHVGSGCYDVDVYADAIRRARDVFDMGAGLGYKFDLLDVGGGFEDATFERAAVVLNDAIERYFPDRSGIKVIAEPGRFYVSRAFSLATNIIARRAPIASAVSVPAATAASADTSVDAGQPKVMYYINEGVYGAFNCIMFDHQAPMPYVLSLNASFHVPSSEPKHAASVWGPTCDSIDCVCTTVQLPEALQVGDWLGFNSMGAYTVCAASRFNGFETSCVIYTTGEDDGEVGREVRRILMEFAAASGN